MSQINIPLLQVAFSHFYTTATESQLGQNLILELKTLATRGNKLKVVREVKRKRDFYVPILEVVIGMKKIISTVRTINGLNILESG